MSGAGEGPAFFRSLAPADREALLLSVVRDSLLAIVTMDSAGLIVEFNPAAEELFARQREDVVGQGLAELLIPPEHRAAHAAGLERYLATGEGDILGRRVEVATYRPDGTLVPVELELTVLHASAGPYFTAFVRDLRPRLESERSLREAQAEAEASSAAKSRFLASMSHELRTPLTAIMGFADLLERGAGDSTQRRSWPAQILLSAKHLLTLLNDLLDLSKLEAGEVSLERSESNVVEMVQEVVDLIQPLAARAELEFESSWPELLPESVALDPLRFKQILLNLLGNAIKFTPSGSVMLKVEVSAELDQLLVRVRDTGIGIPGEDLERVFRPFVQAHEPGASRQRGTGLGLEISRRLAELQGGALSVASEVGVGSEFTLTLPLREPTMVPLAELQVAVAARATQAFSRQALAGLRVLIADDHEAIRQVLRVVFEEQGALVEDVSNGNAAVIAVAIAQVEGRPFDVACFDMQMPILDGAEAVKELRKAGYLLPVIALTAHAMAGDRVACLAAGCNAYLSKPIQPSLLTSTVVELTGRVAVEPKPALPPVLSVDPRFLTYAREFQEGLSAVREALAEAERDSAAEEIRRQAHQLAGVAETFGFKVLGEASRELDAALRGGGGLESAADLLLHFKSTLDESLASRLQARSPEAPGRGAREDPPPGSAC